MCIRDRDALGQDLEHVALLEAGHHRHEAEQDAEHADVDVVCVFRAGRDDEHGCDSEYGRDHEDDLSLGEPPRPGSDGLRTLHDDLTGGVGYKVLGESGMYMNNLVDAVHGVNMTVKEDVIKAMKEAGKPMSAGEVEKATGIDRKEIDKAFKELKAEGAIVSPVRCKWEPAQ